MDSNQNFSFRTPICAFICGVSILFGYWLIALFFPSFWSGFDHKTQIIKEHTLLIQIWYVLVWIVPGVLLILFNRAMLKAFILRDGLFEMILTLTCYATASYSILIGVAEILSAHLLIETTLDGFEQDIRLFMSMIVELRRHLEAYSDSWFLLFNFWLVFRKKGLRLIGVFGVAIVILGFSIILFGEPILGSAYVHGKAFWWIAMSYLLLKVDKIAE